MSDKDFFIPGIASGINIDAATAQSIFKAAYNLIAIGTISEYNISKAANKDQAEAARLLDVAVKKTFDALKECMPHLTHDEFLEAAATIGKDVEDDAEENAGDIEKSGQHYLHGLL